MRRTASVLVLLAAAAAAVGCADRQQARDEIVLPVFASSNETHNFGAPLSGGEEVPPVETRARGNAVFKLSADGSTLHYKLIVAGLDSITQSHIHIAPAGVNGPVVVFLYGFNPAGVAVNGILAEGDITQANLIPRPAIGFGATMAELAAAMRSGNAYVNVHTIPKPGGEIRGQVRESGPS